MHEAPDDPLPPAGEGCWAPYLDAGDDQPASVVVDLGLRDLAPDATRPYLLRAGITLRETQPNGLPTPGELRRVGEMEDVLTASLAAPLGARHVGSVTHNGQRDVICYLRSVEGLERWMAAFQAHFPDDAIDPHTGHDPDWEMYRDVLYPNDPQLCCIRNRQVLAELAGRGDDPDRARRVDHFATFPGDDARETFVSRLREVPRLLTVHDRSEDPARGAERFGLHLRGDHALHLELIDALVVQLAVLAAQCGGRYDGWSCAALTG